MLTELFVDDKQAELGRSLMDKVPEGLSSISRTYEKAQCGDARL